MKALVIGATGKFAGFVVPELKHRGATVRALIRQPAEADAARERGADETAIGNLTEPASLSTAMAGCEGLFFLNPNFMPDEGKVGAGVVDAAKAAGISKVVFSSVIHPSLDRMKNHSGKRPVEAALYGSGLTFTILQPTMFMQTLEMAWPSVRATGRLAQPFSKTAKLSYVDYRDVAEAAALALTSSKLDYGTFELCSPSRTREVGSFPDDLPVSCLSREDPSDASCPPLDASSSVGTMEGATS